MPFTIILLLYNAKSIFARNEGTEKDGIFQSKKAHLFWKVLSFPPDCPEGLLGVVSVLHVLHPITAHHQLSITVHTR